MKRVLSVLTMLAALAGSASAAGYVLPPYQAGALQPSDWMPSYNIEGLYAIGEDNAPDAWGVRGSFSLYDDGNGAVRHQFSISIAGEFGSDSYKFEGVKINQDFWMVPITGAYDMNIGITDSVYLDLGVRAGWATGSYEESVMNLKWKEDYNGFTMGVGAGLKIFCSERLYVKVGYEFNRTFIHDDVGANINQHVITAGIGTAF